MAVDNPMWREPGVVAAIAAFITLVVTKFADGVLKKSSFQLDDSAALRKDLMADNKSLREEIRLLSERITVLQVDNYNLTLKVQRVEDTNHTLQHEIDDLRAQMPQPRPDYIMEEE